MEAIIRFIIARTPYSPPEGDQVDIQFQQSYTEPQWDEVDIDFNTPE